MNEFILLIILGVYTVVYLIIFFIQKAQIDEIKEINTSMKAYMEIFNIDEVKKYVELKSERAIMAAENFVKNHEGVRKIMNEVLDNNVDRVKEVYYKQMGEEHMELVVLTINILKNIKEEEREIFIQRNLPKTSRYFLEILEDINNGCL